MNEIEHEPSTRWHEVDSEFRAASTLLDLATRAAMEWMKEMANMWDYGESPNPGCDCCGLRCASEAGGCAL
jgi:hypothetical protein